MKNKLLLATLAISIPLSSAILADSSIFFKSIKVDATKASEFPAYRLDDYTTKIQTSKLGRKIQPTFSLAKGADFSGIATFGSGTLKATAMNNAILFSVKSQINQRKAGQPYQEAVAHLNAGTVYALCRPDTIVLKPISGATAATNQKGPHLQVLLAKLNKASYVKIECSPAGLKFIKNYTPSTAHFSSTKESTAFIQKHNSGSVALHCDSNGFAHVKAFSDYSDAYGTTGAVMYAANSTNFPTSKRLTFTGHCLPHGGVQMFSK